jgi:hypothetical protein
MAMNAMPTYTRNRYFLTAVLVWMLVTPLALARADDPAGDYGKIREGMAKLAPLAGNWHAAALFHNGDKVSEREGTYDVRWALEDTYLEFHVELHHKDDPSKHNGFVIYVTYNPVTHQYDSTYFYTRWALRVTETGEFDSVAQEYRTKAFIPREGGVRDETVHTVTSLKDPNKIVYTHYSRYSDQAAERMNLEITLTRERP